MITVAILINGNPIVARNAINQSRLNEKGETKYLADSGDVVWHKREDGAVKLAHKLLDLIRNDSGWIRCERCDATAAKGPIPDGVADRYQQLCEDCADEIHKREARNDRD